MAKGDEDAGKGQAQEDEMASQKEDACVLASSLTTGLTCAEDVHKLTVEQLGAIFLSRKEKKPKGKAAMVAAVVGCLALPPLADGAGSSNVSPCPNIGTLASTFPPVPLLPDMCFPSFPITLDPFACALPSLSSSSPLPLSIPMSIPNTDPPGTFGARPEILCATVAVKP